MTPSDLFEELHRGSDKINKLAVSILEQAARINSPQEIYTPELQYHPLGFFCIRWIVEKSKTVRIHVWDKQFNWKQEPNWPIHDHIYSFRSSVLLGEIQNKIYSVENISSQRRWTPYEVSYGGQESAMLPMQKQIGLRISSVRLHQAGSAYQLPAGVFHRSILRANRAITALATTTESHVSPVPRVIGVNPSSAITFNRQPSDDEAAREIIQNAILWLKAEWDKI